MKHEKYQKLKAMQSFKQKFSEMIHEYRNGFRMQQQDKKVIGIKTYVK